jgi:type II secretion system protein N
MFYFFLLAQFPYDGIKKAIVQSFEETLPLTLSIGQVGPSFPVNLLLENIRVQAEPFSMQIPDLTIYPILMGFLQGESGFDLAEPGNSSRLQGKFRQERNKNRLNLLLNNMEIQTASKEFSFSLKLSGEASLQWEGENLEKGNGQVWALLKRSEIQGSQTAQAPLALAMFDTLRTDIQLKNGLIIVKRLEASGKDKSFSLPKDMQFSIRGGRIPPELALFFQHFP